MPTPLKKAHEGLMLLKDAIVDFIREHPEGVRNSEIAKGLEIQSDYEGKNKDFLSFSMIGLLLAEGRLRYEYRGKAKLYFAQDGQK